MSGTEVVRALERLGSAVVRQRGSHIVMRRGSMGCVVPNHRELKLGTPTRVLKQAGVTAPAPALRVLLYLFERDHAVKTLRAG